MLTAVGGSDAEARTNVRSNVFLTATLSAAGVTRPVRIRNISPTGALLDGPSLPPEGSVVQLRRGSLNAAGQIAWQVKDQCGLRFDANVNVQDWVKRVEHNGQARVDEIVAMVRTSPKNSGALTGYKESADCLRLISADLSRSCERLANLPNLVAEHADEILRLDAIAQRLNQFVGLTDDSPDSLTSPKDKASGRP